MRLSSNYDILCVFCNVENTAIFHTTLAEQLNCGSLIIFMIIVHSLEVIHCYNCAKPILKTCGISSTINRRVRLMLVASGVTALSAVQPLVWYSLCTASGRVHSACTSKTTPPPLLHLSKESEQGVWSIDQHEC